MRLYKYIQKDIQQENIQYQDLVEYNTGSVGNPVYPSKKSIIRNYLDAMDFYTPTDTDYACRYRILTKIINKYYNYELFTDNYEYFGNRMLWRLNKIMPTYRAKFNSLLAQNGYEDIWEDGLLWEHREGTRDTKRPEKDTDNHPVNFDRTDLADTTTTVGYNSDYPQVIVGSSTDYNATGDKTTTGRTGNDTVTHAMQENVGYGEDITRKFSPEEIAKAKLLFAQLIFNIDEEIVNAVADLFVLVDYPFEDDFDVAIQMSILDDAKAYTNIKFNESKAYTDTQIGNLPKIIIYYNTSEPTLDDVNNHLSHEDLMLYSDGSKDFFLSDKTSYTMTFGCIVGTKRYSITYTFATQTWSSVTTTELKDMYYLGSFNYGDPPSLTVSGLQSILSNNQYPYWKCNPSSSGAPIFLYVNNDTWGEKYIFQGIERDGSIRRFYLSYRQDSSYDTWSSEFINYQTASNLVTSWGSPTSNSKYPSEKLVKDTIDGMTVFYDIDDVTWSDIESAKNNNKTIYLYTELGSGTKQYWYLDAYLPNTNNDGFARFVQIGGNQQFEIDYQDNQSTSETLDIHDLYECTYGTTTYAQISTALTNKKTVWVKYGANIFFLVSTDAQAHYFMSIINSQGTVRRVQVNTSNVWSTNDLYVQIANLVNSWQATPDNTHYPSEKLVYDSIQNADDFVKVIHGTTTLAEIDTIIANGKIPYISNSQHPFIPLTLIATNDYYFSQVRTGDTVAYATLGRNTGTWGSIITTSLQRNYRVTSWQATPDDTHYPSEKLVYDTIQGIGGSSLVTETVTLLANAWTVNPSGGYSQGVTTVNDPNDYSTVWVSPKTDGYTDYMSDYTSNGIYCKTATFVSLTFQASSIPSQDIVVNVTMG